MGKSSVYYRHRLERERRKALAVSAVQPVTESLAETPKPTTSKSPKPSKTTKTNE